MTTFRAKQIIAKCPNLPTLPAVVQKVASLVADPTAGPKDIGELVAQDPALATRVLKIANSAYYGLRERCLSTEQASAVLGMKVLKNVITAAAVMRQFEHVASSGLDLEGLWRHNVLVGQTASLLARRARGALGLSPDEFYTCGLLHDIGKLVLLENLGLSYATLLTRAAAASLPVQVAEQETLGFDHTDVGAMVAVQWNLPSAVASTIQFHHGPREALEQDRAVTLVANANLLVHRFEAGHLAAAASTFDEPTVRALGLAVDDVMQVLDALAAQRDGVAA